MPFVDAEYMQGIPMKGCMQCCGSVSFYNFSGNFIKSVKTYSLTK